jgi:hypothetical protein
MEQQGKKSNSIENNNPEEITPVSSYFVGSKAFSLSKGPLFYLVSILIILTLVSVSLFLSRKQGDQSPELSPVQRTIPQGAIAKVGEEFIFQQDLDNELSSYPIKKNPNARQLLLNKIATDSIVLQGAAEDKVITLDPTVFNSPNKDYLKRIQLVDMAKNLINNQADGIQGRIISVWFYNNGLIGPLGYNKSKEIAYEKISQLQADVKNQKITINQAAEKITQDVTLDQIDKAYKTNASFKFDAKKGQQITFVPEFDQLLWQLPEGGVTDVFLAKDNEGDKKEALYLFGQVSKKINSNKTSFNSWLPVKQKAYETIYY